MSNTPTLLSSNQSELFARQALFRAIGGDTAQELASAFSVHHVEQGDSLPDELLDNVVIVGSARIIVTTTMSRRAPGSIEGDPFCWCSFAALRAGAVLSAEPLQELLVPVEQRARLQRLERQGLTTFEVGQSGTLFVASGADVRDIIGRRRPSSRKVSGDLNSELNHASGDDLLRTIAAMQWLDRGPDSSLLAPQQRITLAYQAQPTFVDAGEVLLTAGKAASHVSLVAQGVILSMCAPRHRTSIWIQSGSMVGFAAAYRGDAAYDVVAGTDGVVLKWDRARRRDLMLRQNPGEGSGWFARFCDDRYETYSEARNIGQALDRNTLTQNLPSHLLQPLLEGATTVQWRVGAPPPVPVSTSPGLCVITKGEVVGFRTLAGSQHGSVTVLRCEPMSVHRGHLENQKSDEPVFMQALGCASVARFMEHGDGHPAVALNRWAARVPSKGVYIPAWRVERVLRTHTHGRAKEYLDKLELISGHRINLDAIDHGSGTFKDDLNVLWVSPPGEGVIDRRLRAPGSFNRSDISDVELLVELSETIVTSFSESVLLIELASVDSVAGDSVQLQTGPHGRGDDRAHYSLVRLHVEADGALDRVTAYIREHTQYANVLIWRAPDLNVGMSIAWAGDAVLYMNRDSSMPFSETYLDTVPFHVANLVRSRQGAWLPPATCRLHALRTDSLPELGFAGRQATLGRWARAVTHRRVGVALGGGGAWGWAHVALLWAMAARKVPVDLVSGASFGSVTGGILAAGGFLSLRWALENDQRIQRAVNRSMLLGAPIEQLIDGLPGDLAAWMSSSTDHPAMFQKAYLANLAIVRADDDPLWSGQSLQLQHTPVPFYPVATDLVAGSECPIQFGTVGRGVRSSGALPPVFPVAREKNATLADGGLSRNVPADVLHLEGASLIVASNIVPPPFLQVAAPVRTGWRSTLSDLNPLRRMVAAVLGAQTLFNQAGAVNTGLSPILFQSEWNGTMFFQINKGWDIVSDTRADRKFWQAMDGLVDRWQQLEQPRRGATVPSINTSSNSETTSNLIS